MNIYIYFGSAEHIYFYYESVANSYDNIRKIEIF